MTVSTRLQRLMIWSGPAMFVLWVGAFIFLADFIPVPDPQRSPEEVVDDFRDDTDLVRIGLTITLYASALLVPFAAVISSQIKRIEGPRGPLASTQVVSAGLLSLEFIIPIMVWQTAIYRLDDTSAEIVRMLNDMGWLMFVAVISSVIVQFLAIGLAILFDQRENPVLPRWVGYFNLWAALLLTPTSLVVFFKHGAFSWHGAMSFYLPLTVFAIWILVMFFTTRTAIAQEEAESLAHA